VIITIKRDMMKIIDKIGILIIPFALALSLWSCAEVNDEYVFIHDTNTISQMVCRASHSSGEYRGEITEFDKDDNIVEGPFNQEDIEGGYGLILFKIPKTLEKDVDLTNVYLIATVTYDVFITPSLTGKHDISSDGIIITVKSGVGTTRQYRVRGYYE
jgi:hypothetical protein